MARPSRRSAAHFDAIKPDPDQVGGVAEAPFVRLPDPSSVFAARAGRLAALAPGNPLEPYLLLLSRLVDAQHAAQSALPSPSPPDAAQLAQRAGHAMPALTAGLLEADPCFGATLDCLIAQADMTAAPVETRRARDLLIASDAAARSRLASDVFQAAYPVDQLGESLFVAAALQVYLARQAAMLDAKALPPVADGVCPVCGGAPVASLVVGWTQASKARYLCCSLCSTLWNHIRIKCASCGSTEGVSYQAIEGGPDDVAAETCEKCQGYLKYFHQYRNPLQDPFADDVATYGLDILLRDGGWRRSGVNPLLISG